MDNKKRSKRQYLLAEEVKDIISKRAPQVKPSVKRRLGGRLFIRTHSPNGLIVFFPIKQMDAVAQATAILSEL